jgi:hypothetical protein
MHKLLNYFQNFELPNLHRSGEHVCMFFTSSPTMCQEWARNFKLQRSIDRVGYYEYSVNAGIKSLRATLPNEIFYWGFCFLNRAFR